MSVTIQYQADLFDRWWVTYREAGVWVPVEPDIPEEHIEAHLRDPVNSEGYIKNKLTHFPHNGYPIPMTFVHSVRFPDGRIWDSTHRKFFHEVVKERREYARRQREGLA